MAKFNAPFTLNVEQANSLDNRMVVENEAELAAMEYKYEGLETYVKSLGVKKRFNGTDWEDIVGGGVTEVETLPETGETGKLYKVDENELYTWTEKVVTEGEASMPPDKVTLTMEVTKHAGGGASFLKQITKEWGRAYECILVITDVGTVFVKVDVGDIIVSLMETAMIESIDEATGDFTGMTTSDLNSNRSYPSYVGEVYSTEGIQGVVTHYTITQDSKISVDLDG